MKRLSNPVGFGIVALAVLAASPASAFVLADTCQHQEPNCPILHWDTDGDPIPFRLQHDGALDFSFWDFETSVRAAFSVWAEVPGADVEFAEGGLFMGEARYQDLTTETVDRESVLFFEETTWAPRAPEVIALTSITYADEGVIIDADIGFNAVDWQFTLGDDDVQVDFMSIAVHEIGHYLGLDHSDDDAATMFAQYNPGEVGLRTLTDDDRAGLAALYPCARAPCLGDVGPGCSVGRQLAPRGLALLAFLGLVVLAGVRRRGTSAAVLLGGALLLIPGASTGSVVQSLDVDALGERADVIVRAMVSEVAPYEARRVRSEITLDVQESWKGLAPDTVVLDQPGGRLPHLGTVVFGMPRFEAGSEVVVFLRWPEGGEPQVLGLAQGKFDVRGEGVSRDLTGLALAGADAATAKSMPGGLTELRARIGR